MARKVDKPDVDKHDTSEAGPSRLHAPQRPLPVESGKPRLQTFILGRLPPAVEFEKSRLHPPVFSRPPLGGMRPATSTRPHADAGSDTTESGPARLGPHRR